MVLQGIVEIHAPLGEFDTPWSLRDLESTIIVLGKFQPKNCSFNLGSTIITNQLNYRIMKKNIFVALFAIVCVALVVVSVTLVNCHRANVMLRKTVISQANEISELNGSHTSEGTTMFVGLRK